MSLHDPFAVQRGRGPARVRIVTDSAGGFAVELRGVELVRTRRHALALRLVRRINQPPSPSPATRPS